MHRFGLSQLKKKYFHSLVFSLQWCKVLKSYMAHYKILTKLQNAGFLEVFYFLRHKHGFVFPSYTLHGTEEF